MSVPRPTEVLPHGPRGHTATTSLAYRGDFVSTQPQDTRLSDDHPEDFERLCRVFPYAGAVVQRRDWFGVGADKPRGRRAKA